MTAPERPPRRAFLRAGAALAATGALPTLTWAHAGAPAYLAAARLPNEAYVLVGLGADAEARFQIPLPGRGHAAAAHPRKPLAVAFARRPGTFALVIDCALGAVRATLEAPAGRHFYGHGAFSPDGARLFTCENAYESGDGRIGVWSAADGFARIGEFPSQGVGPHELLVDAARGRIVVANGGIRTHPSSGRAKLNLAVMRPNLAYLDLADGAPLGVFEPPTELRRDSLRHIALAPSGLVAVAAQWQGDPHEPVPLLALHRFGDDALRFHAAPDLEQFRMAGYGGSVAISADGARIALTSPRGGRAHLFDAAGAYLLSHPLADVCGAAPGAAPDQILLSSGTGRIQTIDAAGAEIAHTAHRLAWDNHLVPL